MMRELQSSQAEVGRQRDALETERREIARQRYFDSPRNESLVAASAAALRMAWGCGGSPGSASGSRWRSP
jgi:hypothetical protein